MPSLLNPDVRHHTVRMPLLLTLTMLASPAQAAAQPHDPLLRVPPAGAPACRGLSASELPATQRAGALAIRPQRGFEVVWRSGLAGGRRLRLLEDTVQKVALVVDLISPSLPSQEPLLTAMGALGPNGSATGATGRLSMDPVEHARRRAALEANDSAAVRAAVESDFTPLSAPQANRVAPLIAWIRHHCRATSAPE